jgi:hypothetical protein
MALGRSRNVHNVGPHQLQHFTRIRKAHSDPTAFTQLLGHEQFPIAKSDNFTIKNAMDGLHMLIGNLSATDYADS